MINIYDWSYRVERNLVRITLQQTFRKKVETTAKQFNGVLLTTVRGKENEIYYSFKNPSIANDFISKLVEKYPNKFVLKNKWYISQTGSNIITFSCFVESNLSIIGNVIFDMLEDIRVINSLVSNDMPSTNFELAFDSTSGYTCFDKTFSNLSGAQKFMVDFKKFHK